MLLNNYIQGGAKNGAIIIIIIIKNEKIRVTLCENAAGALYIVNKMCVDGWRNVQGWNKLSHPISLQIFWKLHEWPNCEEIGELLQYYMLKTVINFLFKNFKDLLYLYANANSTYARDMLKST